MVTFPPDAVITTTLSVGTIYKIVAPELITTSIPHYFIVVAIDGIDNFLVLCTTNKDGQEKHFKYKNLDLTGLVYIRPDDCNGLTADTYVNCNEYYIVHRSVLVEKVRKGELEPRGGLSLIHYDQIRTGIKTSKTSDIPHSLLIHPND